MDARETGLIAFYVGQLLGVANREGMPPDAREDLERIAVSLATIAELTHPAIVSLRARLEAIDESSAAQLRFEPS